MRPAQPRQVCGRAELLGRGAQGLWRTDPGSTGVQFSGIPALERTGHAPSGWKFNPNAWWVEARGWVCQRSTHVSPGLAAR